MTFVVCWSILLFGCCRSVASAQTATHKVRFYFNLHLGTAVDIELYGNESPLNVANFLSYVNTGSYDGSYIHRSQAGSARFLQGGSFLLPSPPTLDTLDDFRIPTGDPVRNEFDASNGLSNISGTLAAARAPDPDSATSGWFINTTNNSAGFDPGPYTVLGSVTRGLDLLNLVSFNEPVLDEVYTGYESAPFATAPLLYVDGGYQLFVIQKAVEISVLDGDFNHNGTVDDADLMLWESQYGQTGILTADGDGNYVVDGKDFLLWQTGFGASKSSLVAAVAVPEPATLLLLSGALAFMFPRRCGWTLGFRQGLR